MSPLRPLRHRPRPRRRWTGLAAAGAALAVLLTGCGYDETAVPEPAADPTHEPGDPADCTNDDSTLASVPPSDEITGKVAEIRDRERLVVGISADSYLMASRDPKTNRIEGFDIEVIKAIGQAIFGKDFQGGKHIQYRVITAADRIPLLEEGELDMVVRLFTINCSRKEQIAFSAEYYHGTQKMLLREDLAEVDGSGDYTVPENLADLRICAPAGSTSLTNIDQAAPEAEAVPAPNHTSCLVRFQRGEVDAITGDDTVLAGLAAQDPYAVVPDEVVVDSDYGEPYGVGINADDTELVAFVNHALEDMIDSGAWDRAYDRWLADHLGQCRSGCSPGDAGIPPRLRYTS